MKVVVVGAGGFGREVLWLLRCISTPGNPVEILGFVDDDKSLWGEDLCGAKVLGGLDLFQREAGSGARAVCALGNPRAKRDIVERLIQLGVSFHSAIHPACQFSEFVKIGTAAIVAAGTVLTTQVEIADFVTVNLNCTVGHDARLGSYTTLAPGTHISGHVTLGEGVDIGTGAVLLPGVTIGEWTTIGAGAVVTKDMPSYSVAAGVPARVIRELRRPGDR
jgi:sugar O-acyltransferase (sialic acid O-acetyltransferase NeuD family)